MTSRDRNDHPTPDARGLRPKWVYAGLALGRGLQIEALVIKPLLQDGAISEPFCDHVLMAGVNES